MVINKYTEQYPLFHLPLLPVKPLVSGLFAVISRACFEKAFAKKKIKK